MEAHGHLDAHEKPPDAMREVFKKFQKILPSALTTDADVLDFGRALDPSQQCLVKEIDKYDKSELVPIFQTFCRYDSAEDLDYPPTIPVYQHDHMPGKVAMRVCCLWAVITSLTIAHPNLA